MPGAFGEGSGSGAQAGGGGGGGAITGFHGPQAAQFQLARDPAVQTDLALSPDQRRAIAAAAQRVDASSRNLNNISQRLFASQRPGPEFDRILQNAQAQTTRDCEAAASAALATLTPAQRKRLDEIRYQSPMILLESDPHLEAMLGLTPHQRDHAQRIGLETNQEMLAAMRAGMIVTESNAKEERSPDGRFVSRSSSGRGVANPDPAVRAETDRRIQEAIARRDQRLFSEVLTPEQQARLTQLRGAPFRRTPMQDPGVSRPRPQL